MALGGGGTTSLTGYETLFSNPANLYMQHNDYSVQFSILQSSLYFDTLQPVQSASTRFRRYYESMDYHRPNSSLREISLSDKESILNSSFRNNRSSNEFSSLTELHWFGVKWVRPQRSYAISMRSRIASRYEIGSGFFDTTPLERGDDLIVNQTLNHRYQVLHELSFGFGESFSFLNGLVPRFSEFFVGIAPKLVASGSYIDSRHTNRYRFNEGNGLWFQSSHYTQESAGIISDYPEQFFGDPTIESITPNYNLKDLIEPSGLGIGIDIGITYIMTFGDDFSETRIQNHTSEHTLRASLSITDIGAVRHYRNPLVVETGFINTDSGAPPTESDVTFDGKPNQHLAFLSQFNTFQNLKLVSALSSENYYNMLPMAVNAGILYQFKRAKLMLDSSYSFTDNAFNPSGFTSYAGLELRPLSFFPIRVGTRLANKLQNVYSVGTGIETKWFDFSAAVLFRSSGASPTSEILGASVVNFKFYW